MSQNKESKCPFDGLIPFFEQENTNTALFKNENHQKLYFRSVFNVCRP